MENLDTAGVSGPAAELKLNSSVAKNNNKVNTSDYTVEKKIPTAKGKCVESKI